MNRDNIILIGMPGVGKSTIGVVLAKVLGYQFVDADLLIQEAEGKLLSELIEENGTDGFIEIENRVNSQIQTHRSVIATGGSVIYGKEAMEHLKSIGTVVYLKQNLRVLQRRLRNLKGRGVVLKEGQTLADLYKERTVLYEKYADITVDQYKQTIQQTLKAVQEALKENQEPRRWYLNKIKQRFFYIPMGYVIIESVY